MKQASCCQCHPQQSHLLQASGELIENKKWDSPPALQKAKRKEQPPSLQERPGRRFNSRSSQVLFRSYPAMFWKGKGASAVACARVCTVLARDCRIYFYFPSKTSRDGTGSRWMQRHRAAHSVSSSHCKHISGSCCKHISRKSRVLLFAFDMLAIHSNWHE